MSSGARSVEVPNSDLFPFEFVQAWIHVTNAPDGQEPSCGPLPMVDLLDFGSWGFLKLRIGR